MEVRPGDALYEFFRPIHATREGRILTLEQTHYADGRDWLAATQIGRLFPINGYERVVVERSTERVFLHANMILVGCWPPQSSSLRSGREMAVGHDPQLWKRFEQVEAQARFRFEFHEAAAEALVDELTGRRLAASRSAELHTGYGRILRVGGQSGEFTMVVGGTGRLGTLGAVCFATSSHHLTPVWQAVRELSDFADELPLEVIVETTFRPHFEERSTLVNVAPALVTIAYNRSWAYDPELGVWLDQRPWDLHLGCRRKSAVAAVSPRTERAVPRLELELDLRSASAVVRERCRRLATGREPLSNLDTELLEQLVLESDGIGIVLFARRPITGKLTRTPLPTREPHSEVARHRKRFMVQLLLYRAADRQLVVDEAMIRRLYPSFKPVLSGKKLVQKFKAEIKGRLRDSGFLRLFGKTSDPHAYVRIVHSRSAQTYALELGEAELHVKVRIDSPGSH